MQAPTKPRPHTPTHKRIQHYSYGLSDTIGQGYSSTVYRGRDDRTSQLVAIKVIDLKKLKDKYAKQMLQSQIQTLRSLSHPNILQCHDIFTTMNNCYIVTEFCEGGDLAGVLKRKGGRVTESEARRWMGDIVKGFLEMAGKQYLHRDLKPANVLIKRGVAKIADFGFAKKDQGSVEKYNVGSPLYMSPEALAYNKYSTKNDIWAMGIILYEMLHGRAPWDCVSEQDLAKKMLLIPAEIDPNISKDIRQFIEGCLRPDQDKRFGVDEFENSEFVRNIIRKSQSINPQNTFPKAQNISTRNSLPIYQTDKQNFVGRKTLLNRSKDLLPCSQPLSIPLTTVRLLYHILSQLKLSFPSQTHLIHVLSKQILLKINYLKALTSSDNLPDQSRHFKTVINEYYNKYSEELNEEDMTIAGGDYKVCLVTFLKMNSRNGGMKGSNIGLFYWVAELLGIVRGDGRGVRRVEEIVRDGHQVDQAKLRLRIMQL